VKQFCADDSAATSVKVGYRQACYIKKPHQPQRAQDRAGRRWGFFPSAFSSALFFVGGPSRSKAVLFLAIKFTPSFLLALSLGSHFPPLDRKGHHEHNDYAS
ncbi:hypothetical protein, partial [Janthinobacterium sp. CG_S6]|uniref:hypothetical protein n=1 Tax=Janthinobacterium sp. CG_S6 TaxID=3071707 RepID=UPI002E0E6878